MSNSNGPEPYEGASKGDVSLPGIIVFSKGINISHPPFFKSFTEIMLVETLAAFVVFGEEGKAC